MPTKYTKIANLDDFENCMDNHQADILALANIVKDLSDSVMCLYGFCRQMFDLHWPPKEVFEKGEACLDYAQERLKEARVFDYETRKWLKEIEKEENGEGDRK